MFEDIFAARKIDPRRLLTYGFVSDEQGFSLKTTILDGEYSLLVSFDPQGRVETALTEIESGEEYLLYKTKAQGNYVGMVRETIENTLANIARECFIPAAFRFPQTDRLLTFALDTWGSRPEFLWDDTPDCAILRRADSEKWFAALMTISARKLGMDSDKIIEIVNFHTDPADMEKVQTSPHTYPGWHMNKKSWFTIILDDSMDDDTLFAHMIESYRLAAKPTKRTKGKQK